MPKRVPIKRFKPIKCKTCGKPCKSGKKGLCDTHYAAEQMAKASANTAQKKSLSKRPLKKKSSPRKIGEKITDRKLHQVFSWLVRAIYPEYCHACKVERPAKYLQACHFVPRGKKVITWYLKNVLPGCPACNGFRQEHVYFLGLAINEYYGVGTAETLSKIGKEVKEYKFDQLEKRKLYELFTLKLKEVNVLKQTYTGQKLDEELEIIRLDIISKTTYF